MHTERVSGDLGQNRTASLPNLDLSGEQGDRPGVCDVQSGNRAHLRVGGCARADQSAKQTGAERTEFPTRRLKAVIGSVAGLEVVDVPAFAVRVHELQYMRGEQNRRSHEMQKNIPRIYSDLRDRTGRVRRCLLYRECVADE